MRKHVSLTELNDWLYALPDAKFEELVMMPKADTARGTEDEHEFAYHLCECTYEFYEYVVSQRLYVRGGWITYDPDLFGNISAAASAVMADYDDDFDALRELGCFPPYRNDDGSPAEGTPWKKWNLGGDDDVDYNGSYILAALDILSEYEKAHP